MASVLAGLLVGVKGAAANGSTPSRLHRPQPRGRPWLATISRFAWILCL